MVDVANVVPGATLDDVALVATAGGNDAVPLEEMIEETASNKDVEDDKTDVCRVDDGGVRDEVDDERLTDDAEVAWVAGEAADEDDDVAAGAGTGVVDVAGATAGVVVTGAATDDVEGVAAGEAVDDDDGVDAGDAVEAGGAVAGPLSFGPPSPSPFP